MHLPEESGRCYYFYLHHYVTYKPKPMFYEACNSLLDLVFPRICAACDDHAPVRKGIFCIQCLADLPETNFHDYRDNLFTMHFWGRVGIRFGSAFLFYVPGGSSQKLIHNIKYNRQPHYAEAIGRHYGAKLLGGKAFIQPDLIIPVPLHWKKEQSRGFNQSNAFGKGLSDALDTPCKSSILVRTRSTTTQTRKSRDERIRNMSGAFEVVKPSWIRNKHLLLIDDVLTTGATLEACANTLLQIPGVSLSMATIAMGRI